MNLHTIRPEAPLYNPDTPRWWVSNRQRILVLTFPSEADAQRWDENPTLDHIVSS